MKDEARVYSVGEIAGALRRTLEDEYGRVRVRGEISNFRPASSGHLYFALKDDRAQLKTVMFRGAAIGLRFLPADGVEVEAEGEISLYEPRGDLQLIVRRMVPSGRGALMQAFEALKRRLEGEGLFDPSRKRPLPVFPRTVGIITSPTGAAVRDLIHVLRRRWPPVEIVFIPVRVQGEGAAEEIAAAVDRMSRWGGAEVLIVGRGGGSLEDLWAFNEEPVARALAACTTPVVSAVGHETDFTIADLVADRRAATPSAAAETVVPDRRDVMRQLTAYRETLRFRVEGGVSERRRRLARLVGAYGFRKPEVFLQRELQRLDVLAGRLDLAVRDAARDRRERAARAAGRLSRHHPEARWDAARNLLRERAGRLRGVVLGGLDHRRDRLEGLGRALGALDPTGVLNRGYTLVRDARTGRVLATPSSLTSGDPFVVQFSKGRIHGRVLGTSRGGPMDPVGEGQDES